VPGLHKDLRRLWDKAGYRPTMGSAAVVPPPSVHYRRLYHFTSTDHAISSIAFSRLKVALLDQLNDPFELLGANVRRGDIHQTIRELKQQWAKVYGLLCFSEDWTDPVLWSHYAGQHTGICLGFDVPSYLAQKVEYQQERIKMDGAELDDRTRTTLLKTKFKSWEYEHEWRVLVHIADAHREGPLHFEKIGRRIHLAEVILGVLCVASVEEVREFVDAHHEDVTTFQARLASGHFSVVPHEPTTPDKPSSKHVR
jgi:hypothetical protein